MSPAPWPASSPFAKEHESRSREEGRRLAARALLALLNVRGLEVSAAERERINSCSNIDQLQMWIDRADKVEAAADLFS
ncbi:hypothetical protein [Actinomadura sp. 6N118]|uniref:hypothetical protein n=1 Tax=Actinomadura sp. 6N118 TaxID=3375151 RepID=UPI0037AEEBB1